MDIFSLVARLTLDSSQYKTEIDQSKGLLSGLGAAANKGFTAVKKAAKVGAVAIGAATAAVGAFVASSVSVGAEFDKSMSQVAATMGKTTDEISDLREFAQEMGRTTAFSATQAADALNYMALAGYSSEESMAMLPTVLNLAAAGSMDLATASDMVTDASSALGLSMDETTEMVDKMAKASSQSNTSVAQLGEAFLTVGGTAKDLAGGTTELSTVLGILADNGIKGAEGGTALRNIMLSLEAPTDKAAAAMKDLGLEVYDANGNLRPMEEIFGDLNGRLETMTQGERTQVLNDIFNKVDLKSVNALLGTNVERWDELTSAIDDSKGAADKMASTQLDNLAGDVTLFKSALEGAQIAISDVVTPALRDFVQFGTDSVSDLTTAFKEDGLNGAMEALGNIIADGSVKLIEGLPTFVNAGISLLGAIGNGIVQAMQKIAAAIWLVFQTIKDYIDEHNPELGAAIDAVVGFFESAWNTISTLWTNTLEPAITTAIEKFTTFWNETLIPIAEFIGGAFTAVWDNITAKFGLVMDAINGDEEATQKLYDIFKKILPVVTGLVTAFIAYRAAMTISTIIDAVRNATVGLSLAQTILNAVMEANPFVLIASLLAGLVTAFITAYETDEDFRAKIDAAWTSIKTLAEDVWGAIVGWFEDVGDTFHTVWIKYLQPVANWFSDVFTTAIDGVKTAMNNIKDFLNGVFSTNWATTWENIVNAVSKPFELLKEILKTPINAVVDLINGLIDKLETGINTIINGINHALTISIPPFQQTIWNPFGPDWTIGFNGWNWSPNIGTVNWSDKHIQRLAKGGVLREGEQAFVGENAPEYLRVVNGQAIVTPLRGAERPSGDEISINIYQQPGESPEVLADKVERVLIMRENQRRAAMGY